MLRFLVKETGILQVGLSSEMVLGMVEKGPVDVNTTWEPRKA